MEKSRTARLGGTCFALAMASAALSTATQASNPLPDSKSVRITARNALSPSTISTTGMFRSDLKNSAMRKSAKEIIPELFGGACPRAPYSALTSGFNGFWQWEQHGILLSHVTSRVSRQNGQRPDHS